MAPADVESLRTENARLASEMASMKKKMMQAIKKQSTEVKLAQQRAEAAEAALAAVSNGSVDAASLHSGNESASSEVGSQVSLDSSIVRATSGVSEEGTGDRNDADVETLAEGVYLKEREVLALEARRSAEEKEKLEAVFRELKLSSDQIMEQLMERNRSLESQLEEISRIRVEQVRSSDVSPQHHEGVGASGVSDSEESRTSENVNAATISLLGKQLMEANEKVEKLEGELNEQVRSLQASEAADLDVKNAHPPADKTLSELNAKLLQVNKQLEEEVTKYNELDAKFGRLLKRSKQRILEVQKEKDDVEVQFKALEEKASEATARLAALQADLNATRNQAGDSIRNLDSERQQSNTALRRARQDIEEMRQVLGARELELNELSSQVFEKDQQITGLNERLIEAEAKQEVAILGLKDTHQKAVNNYAQQLAEATKDRIKGDEALSSLQAQLAENESKLAGIEAASSGEVVRLSALLDAARGDIQRIQSEHEKERETEREQHKSSILLLMDKLKTAELWIDQVEIRARDTRSELESELDRCRQILSATQVELATARVETKLQGQELAAYKVRAHALLQKKEAALQAAQDSSSIVTLESALEEAKAEATAASAARDQVMRKLDATVADYQRRFDAQVGAIEEAELHMRHLATQLESSKALVKSQQAEYERRLNLAEESLSLKSEVPATTPTPVNEDLEREITAIRLAEKHLKEEFESYKEMTNSMMSSKDEEMMRLLEDRNSLQKHLSQKASSVVTIKSVTSSPPPPLAEQQILILARLQAQKEEEVARCLRHIEALQEEIKEREQENRLRCHQITILKEEYHNSERNQKRSTVDMTYVKNVILKLLETGEVEALLPVIAMLLQFSPDEMHRCQEAYNMRASAEVPLSGAAAVVDAATAAPRSLLSRFTLS